MLASFMEWLRSSWFQFTPLAATTAASTTTINATGICPSTDWEFCKHEDLDVDLENSGMVLLVQEITIVGAIVILLFTVAYFILAQFAKPKSGIATVDTSEENLRDTDRIPFCCSFLALAVTIGGVLLVPIAILATQVMQSVSNTELQYYFNWLTPGLIYGLWDVVFWGDCLCFFVVIPFGFFWSQAVGGVYARLLETLLLLALVVVLHALSQWLLWSFIPLPKTFLDVSSHEIWMLPFSFSLISGAGSLIFMAFTPRGRTQLFLLIWKLHSHPKLSDHAAHAATFELEHLAVQLCTAQRKCLERIVENPQLTVLLSAAEIHSIEDLADITMQQLRNRLEQVLRDLGRIVAASQRPELVSLFDFNHCHMPMPNVCTLDIEIRARPTKNTSTNVDWDSKRKH